MVTLGDEVRFDFVFLSLSPCYVSSSSYTSKVAPASPGWSEGSSQEYEEAQCHQSHRYQALRDAEGDEHQQVVTAVASA